MSSCPASPCLFSTLRRNLVLIHGIPPAFSGGVYLFIYTTNHHRVSPEFIKSRNCVSGVRCRESTSTGPVVLKVVPVTGAAFSGIIMDQLACASLRCELRRQKIQFPIARPTERPAVAHDQAIQSGGNGSYNVRMCHVDYALSGL